MSRVLADKLWKIWFSLPHSRFFQQKYRRKVRARFDYANLSGISVIAPNCISGELYAALGLQFRTPFVNCFMKRDEFIKMCGRLREYMACPLEIAGRRSDYWVAVLGDGGLEPVRICFPHDDDPTRIAADWERRKQRINYDKLVLICDDLRIGEGEMAVFERIPAFRKILFTARDHSGKFACAHQLRAYERDAHVGMYCGKMLRGVWRFETMWEYADFLNGEA